MLASFPAELWQVLIFWAVIHPETVNSERSRQEAVRLALFWYLCVWKHEKAARWAFEQIRKMRDTTALPGVVLYELFTGNREDCCAHQLISPKEFEQSLCKAESCSWRTDEERFGSGISRNVFGSHWWWNGKKMLPWLQKDYIHRVFRGYVPLSDHEDDVPYDVDHMCAQKDWGENWQSLKHRLRVDKSLLGKIEQGRGAVGNGIGNLQLLESSKNRSWQDVDVSTKMPFILHDDEPPILDDEQAMADFAFNPEDRKLWRRVSEPSEVSKQWNEDRLKAFQQAVEKRAVWLYQRFHNELGFGEWTMRREGKQPL